MTKQDYTALVFVVDVSGSMWDIASDMEGGISALLETQKDVPGKLTVDTVYFNSAVRFADKFANPEDVDIKLNCGGGTALYDAVGSKIDDFGKALGILPEEDRPDNVIFAIVTDGYENSSREYTVAQVKERVKRQTDEYGWNFVYLGANQDAVFVAEGLGIGKGGALTYNTANVGAMALAASEYVTTTRSGIAYNFTEADRLANK